MSRRANGAGFAAGLLLRVASNDETSWFDSAADDVNKNFNYVSLTKNSATSIVAVYSNGE